MWILIFVAAHVVLFLNGCHKPAEPIELSGNTMGTQYHISIVPPAGEIDVAAIQRDIDTALDRLNNQMSTYLPASEISEFNSRADVEWFEVSPEFAAVVHRARQFSEKSRGAFDATVGPLVNRWNFGPEKESADMPSADEVATLTRSVGFQLISVRNVPPAIRKQRPDVQLDLSAIAKGFAVDHLTELLAARGLKNFMVEIGGEIRVRGFKAGGIRWTVGIEKPLANQRVVQRVVHLRDAALATSGDYRNFIEIDGHTYSHMIDPRTGYPVDHTMASVSVVADDCLSADAWATALMVLGPREGYDLAQREGLAALFIERVGGQFAERATSEFERILVQSERTAR